MPQNHSWSIPRVGAESLTLTATPGEMTLIVGPNGSGKSSLLWWMSSQIQGHETRTLHAHRPVTMESSASKFSAADASSHATWVAAADRDARSRYQDAYSTSRPNLTLHRLASAQNYRSNRIADAFDSGTTPDLDNLGQAPLRSIGEILESSGLPMRPSINTDGLIEFTRTEDGVKVPLQEASDGERAALLLSADVLTAPADCITVIDEPEMHLHRDLAPRLLAAALQKRPDQHFIVSTHDVTLAAALPNATILVVKQAHWNGKSVTGWTVERLEPGGDLPEEVRRGILGGRTRILFVEGNEVSHDSRLYRAMFPDWTVKPAGSCETVIRIAAGTAAAQNIHWLEVRGIIDNDARSEEECRALNERGVHVLPVCELESLLYLKPVLDRLTSDKAEELGEDYAAKRSTVDTAIAQSLSSEQAGVKLASDLAKKVVHRKADNALRAAIAENPNAASQGLTVQIDSDYPKLLQKYHSLIGQQAYEKIIMEYPVRNIGMRAEIAKSLGYRHYDDLEKAAISTIVRNHTVRAELAKQSGLEPLLGALSRPSAESDGPTAPPHA